MPATFRTRVAARLSAFFGLDDEWVRPRPTLSFQDVALAAAMMTFGLLSLELARSAGAFDDSDATVWAMYAAVASGGLLLLGRRRWPLAVASLAAAHMFVAGVTMPLVMGQLPLQAVYFVALLSGVAWARDRRLMAVVVGAILVFMFAWVGWQFAVGQALQGFIDEEDQATRYGVFAPVPAYVAFTVLVNIVYFGGAVLGGAVAWRAARNRVRLEEQAATITGQSEQLRDQAVVDERLRIARELHDVVAHHVSAMGVQAGAARRVIDRNPDAARTALANVEEASRDAVTQMRGLLGTLRMGEEPDQPGRTTDPGIADLADLARPAGDHGGGLQVDLTVVEEPTGAADRVGRSLGLSVYRTVQEALTNVRRHSTADRASVVVRVDEAGPTAYVEVEVLDSGRPRTGSSGSGMGQLGIRERAASHHGEVEIGPRLTGGYRVRVRFPLGAR